jgi:ribosomal protein S18 acetylase RimI-like enzyme
MLAGFFVGWPSPPSPEKHLRLLLQSYRIVLAVDDEAGRVVGFVSAIGDGVLSAHITLFEVLPAYQGRGIGQALMRIMIGLLGDLHAVDLICDGRMQPFYARFGMQAAGAMMLRNYELQAGRGQ